MIAGQSMSNQIKVGYLQKCVDGSRCVLLPRGPCADLGELRRQRRRRAPKERMAVVPSPIPISSGVIDRQALKIARGTAICTNPLPSRSADVPAKAGAPIIPSCPPTISTRPNVPLCPSAGRGGSGGAAMMRSTGNMEFLGW